MSQPTKDRVLRSRTIKATSPIIAQSAREVGSRNKKAVPNSLAHSSTTKSAGTAFPRKSLPKTATPASTSKSNDNKTAKSVVSIRSNKSTPNSNGGSTNRLSSANNSVTATEVKLLTEKIIVFESRINEIYTICEQLKDENLRLQYAALELADLQNKIDESEISRRQLATENDSLKSEIVALKAEVSELSSDCRLSKSEIQTLKSELSEIRSKPTVNPTTSTSAAGGVSIEQQELNSNIVIRGIEQTPDYAIEPKSVYNSVRDHLGIGNDDEFEPIAVNFVRSSTAKTSSAGGIIQVRLRSSAAKKQFLQIRRRKKDITLADIGLCPGSQKSILITEQLTRCNQELLFAARSLRDSHKFKFVWSSDGQILVRSQQNAKVTRISDISQVDELRSQANLPPFVFPKNGSPGSRINIKSAESHTQS